MSYSTGFSAGFATVATPVTQTFAYTGAAQTFTVPDGVTLITCDVQAAAGGTASGSNTGGPGARVQCDLTVTPAEVLQINVGQTGIQNGGVTFGGGGSSFVSGGFGASGGGGSDIRRGAYALADRLVIAGGGGGSGGNNTSPGGKGGQGATLGGNANPGDGSSGSQRGEAGHGGTASSGGNGGTGPGGAGAGGALGVGGNGANGNVRAGGGGGGGYYGGGGGGGGTTGGGGGGGGGGSSIGTGVAETITAGYRTGNGQIVLTWVAAPVIPPEPTEPWAPGDAWPGTPGGGARKEWSGYVRVYLQAEIAAGTPFVMGDSPSDTLDAGNVMSQAGTRTLDSKLWVDLTCDVTDLEVRLGSAAGAGILSKSEAGTLQATLYDPDGKYDPYNPDTPFALGNKTRLTPGVRVACWAEVIADPAAETPTVVQYALFWGTADRWSYIWKQEPGDRYATLIATDPTKQFTRFDKPALVTAAGSGDSPLFRLTRIASNHGWTGTVQSFGSSSTQTLQATTLANPAWEEVNRTATDELGFAYFVPVLPTTPTVGILALATRGVWLDRPAPAIEIGCGDGLHDIATQVLPASFDEQLKNAVYAARTGGTQQTVKSASSIAEFWEQSLERTDLGLASDAQVAAWAQTLVTLYAYPQTSIDRMTLRPDMDPAPWTAWQLVLAKALIVGLVRVVWDRAGYTVDATVRLAGWTHKITGDRWQVEWRTVASGVSGAAFAFTMGPDTQDLLDAGYGLA